MITKSDTVRSLVANGDYKKALGIIKGFKRGISKQALNKLIRAYECMTHKRFYEQLGTDTAKVIDEGIEILKDLYGESKDQS